jgi:hypothetical protein
MIQGGFEMKVEQKVAQKEFNDSLNRFFIAQLQ